MSGGEQQRLKFAIALVGRPELVFLDEPTAGLDAHAKRIVWDVVNQLRENGVSVVLTTHLMDDVEQLANKVAVVNNGKVVACGSPSELTASAQPVLHFQAIPGIDLTDLRQNFRRTQPSPRHPPGTINSLALRIRPRSTSSRTGVPRALSRSTTSAPAAANSKMSSSN